MRQGYCYTCLAIGGGGYFSRVTKPESVQKVTYKCLKKQILDTFKSPLEGPKAGHTPIFGDTLSHTPRCTSGRKGPKTLVGGHVSLNERTVNHVYLNSIQQMVSGEFVRVRFSRHGLLDVVKTTQRASKQCPANGVWIIL